MIQVTGAVYGPNHDGSPPCGVTSDAKGCWKAEGLAPGTAKIMTSAEWQTVPFAGSNYSFQLPRVAPVEVKVKRSAWASK